MNTYLTRIDPRRDHGVLGLALIVVILNHQGLADDSSSPAELQPIGSAMGPQFGGASGTDSDSDGLPDAWELAYFSNLSQGANGDPDNDGMTNLDEFLEGTNPAVFNEVPGNLMLNGHVEYDAGTNDIYNHGVPMNSTPDGIPDHWIEIDPAGGIHELTWGQVTFQGRTSRVLKTAFTGGISERQSFRYEQRVVATQTPHLEPGCWYEFSVSVAFDRVEPYLILDDRGYEVMEKEAAAIFASLSVYPGTSASWYTDHYRSLRVEAGSKGPRMTGWDASTWTYTDFARPAGPEGWRTVRQYFKAPNYPTLSVAIYTTQRARGIGYFDNFVLRKVLTDEDGTPSTPPVNLDPSALPLQRDGSLDFIQYKGQDFFPIVLSGFPKGLLPAGTPPAGTSGVFPPNIISLRAVRTAGFNTSAAHNAPGNLPGAMWAFSRPTVNMAMYAPLSSPFVMEGDENGDEQNSIWLMDPPRPYVGSDQARDTIDTFYTARTTPGSFGLPASFTFQNLFAFMGLDETDCGYGAAQHGMFLGELLGTPQQTPAHEMLNYATSVMPDIPLFNNFCKGPTPYNGVLEDKVLGYLPTADIVSFTNNLRLAMPYVVERDESGNFIRNANATPELPRVGEGLRRMMKTSQDYGIDARFIGFAAGCPCWLQWDGEYAGSLTYHCDKYIPFNLQRYTIYDQIISGAVGIGFLGSHAVDLRQFDENSQPLAAYPYQAYFWEQMKTLSKELDGLSGVLLEPEFFDDWYVNTPNIDIMMKRHNGMIYLFAANRNWTSIPSVTIRLTGMGIDAVTALTEDANGEICNGCRRTITTINAGSFTDGFDYQDTRYLTPPVNPQEYPNADSHPALRGYGVHIYEIVAHEVEEVLPAALIVGVQSRKTHTNRGGQDISMALVGTNSSEPRMGGITELRVGFDVPPGEPIAAPAVIYQRTCGDSGSFVPYTGAALMSGLVSGNELVLTFAPALENLRTYRIDLAPGISSVPAQSITLRGLVGDVNGSGDVGTLDRSVVVNEWTSTSHYSAQTDLNRDGITNASDRSVLMGAWGSCAP